MRDQTLNCVNLFKLSWHCLISAVSGTQFLNHLLIQFGLWLVGGLLLWPGTALGVEATVVNKTGENGTLYWEVRQIKQASLLCKQSNHRILVTITNNNANSDSDKKISALTDKMAGVCLLF